MKVKKLHPDAVIPQYAKPGDSGFDLVAVEDVYMPAGETCKIPIGLAFEIPEGYEMQIRPRSGMTSKTKIRVQLGTIDSGYRGEVSVIADNIAKMASYYVHKGERIAQGVIAPVVKVEFEEVEELSTTERGSGGFGHTGY
ncbi:deoxyuridine 5'-triphosphate nucleotidohydrolase [Paenibacillus sp. FSL H7-0326]|uniref:dUTP diphosphatase n=1 Tax=Paenibacillus sp. FSL H7-0326 TaxID=1921144 RepID=UPI00096CD18B|nr:dUTP diphosphatase [Paenibacillus sp. FSL H7-0326]OMC71493.1 deoxyuridine 5'-triphosphate nucleotidohydrolase [Paenibacillus sp. FSL H7-0326]